MPHIRLHTQAVCSGVVGDDVDDDDYTTSATSHLYYFAIATAKPLTCQQNSWTIVHRKSSSAHTEYVRSSLMSNGLVQNFHCGCTKKRENLRTYMLTLCYCYISTSKILSTYTHGMHDFLFEHILCQLFILF